MAFHQQTRQNVQRTIRPVADEQNETRLHSHHLEQATPEDSQTWVLFSPATDATTSASYLSDAEESIPTPGRSRLSDIGSLNTVPRSNQDTGSRHSVVLSTAIDDESVEDDAELDSLDSHLPDFRTFASAYQHVNSSQHAAPVLPTHDGLGSFRLDHPVGPEVQDHLYAFEQFNPRRTRRRRESLDMAELQLQQEEDQQAHKIQRIEAWRLEQSRVLLEEIHKETRRRRKSQSSARPQSQMMGNSTSSSAERERTTVDLAEPDSMDWHEEASPDSDEDRGFFARLTRKVIRDLIGIDERMLAILLGEALPEDDMSTTPKAEDLAKTPTPEIVDGSSWQLQILDRVARELGLIVNQISPHPHPGAFSTYTRMQQMPLPYAGLPAIPEAMADSSNTQIAVDASIKMPEFKPTAPHQAQPMDIPSGRGFSDGMHAATSRAEPNATASAAFTQSEWEQDLDVKLVFRYLRSRFSSRSSSTPTFTSGTSHLATCSTQDSAAKAARVRQHHPLVGRTRPQAERRTFKATAPASPAAAKRHASSCASQSTRRSARRSSVSSRHYWDIGGSLGTGSMIASAGPMGSWGEI
ncbi:hypothetical protein HYQ44_015838 [Verticillium longisporum]|nr:hypothetical protein HYQ44_015838 [Verticillium longisporum]